MKKILTILLSICIISSAMACTAAKADDYQNNSPAYSDNTTNVSEEALIKLIVNGTVVDTSKLPSAFYKDGDAVLVPALVVCEGLGYICSWDNKTGTLIVENSIQKAALTKGEKDAEITGKLKVINLSGTFSLDATISIIDGVVYVPADLFGIFFNSVEVTDDSVSISEVVYYIDD